MKLSMFADWTLFPARFTITHRLRDCILALLLLIAAPMCAQPGGGSPVRVAVLKDNLPGLDLTSVEQTISVLKGAEFSVRAIDIGQLGSKDSFNASQYDCLVLSHSRRFTAAAKQNFASFLKDGGDLVFLGGNGFTQPDSIVLPAFSRYEPYVLKDAVSVRTSADQKLLKPMQVKGQFAGLSAVGFNRVVAKFVPLLSAMDAQGRTRGWASGLLTHFDEYKGSNWLLFGISNPEFYQTGIFAETLKTMLVKMKSGELERIAAAENEKRLAARIKLTTPAPAAFLRVSEDGKHILYPDGRRFFMIGANYHRPLNGVLRNARDFDHAALEDDFRKARDAGLNCMRIGFSSRFYDDPDLVRECARKYGIYLLIVVAGRPHDFVENAGKLAEMYADEPMVLGYDLQNEPPAELLAGLEYDGAKSPVLKLHPEFEKNLPAFAKLWNQATDHWTRGVPSTFPGLIGPIKVPDEWRELYRATNDTLDLWISKQIQAIRKYDKHHFISVGYNRFLECLPANKQLSFVSHHVYDRPSSYEQVISNVTTLDRIASVWSDRPITLGEFGYSNGVVTSDGRYLDFHTSAVGEMIHYLYALAKGYDGAMKWVLTDWHWDVIAKAAEKGRNTQIYEAYFGMYYYDGNPRGLGRPKPICYSTKFLRDYVDGHGPGGTLEIRRAQTSIGAGYVYKAKNALFVGDYAYKSPELEFRSQQPANVMVTWSGDGIKLMSTSDATVSVAPQRLISRITPESAKLEGNYGSVTRENGRLSMRLLEGETIRIR
jgi:hypothetical protein